MCEDNWEFVPKPKEEEFSKIPSSKVIEYQKAKEAAAKEAAKEAAKKAAKKAAKAEADNRKTNQRMMDAERALNRAAREQSR